MNGCYLGLDLTSRPAHPTAYAVLTDDPAQPPRLGYLAEDREILDCVNACGTWAVAIDAPLGLPDGWRCLDIPCGCGECLSPTEDRRRACEVELVRRGIPCFWTTRRSIIKSMVYRGIALQRSLLATGYQVLEVFPYAAKRMLWGKQIPRKSTDQGLAYLQTGLTRLIPGLADARAALTHDLADALLAAYTARLHRNGRTETLGIAGEGQIVLPTAVLLNTN